MKTSPGWGLLTLGNRACVVELCYTQLARHTYVGIASLVCIPSRFGVLIGMPNRLSLGSYAEPTVTGYGGPYNFCRL